MKVVLLFVILAIPHFLKAQEIACPENGKIVTHNRIKSVIRGEGNLKTIQIQPTGKDLRVNSVTGGIVKEINDTSGIISIVNEKTEIRYLFMNVSDSLKIGEQVLPGETIGEMDPVLGFVNLYFQPDDETDIYYKILEVCPSEE